MSSKYRYDICKTCLYSSIYMKGKSCLNLSKLCDSDWKINYKPNPYQLLKENEQKIEELAQITIQLKKELKMLEAFGINESVLKNIFDCEDK